MQALTMPIYISALALPRQPSMRLKSLAAMVAPI